MRSARPNASGKLLGLSPVVAGTAYCILSALCYTAANTCLRKLADEADKPWTICIKEAVTVVVIGPWLLVQAYRGRRVLPSLRILLLLALTGLAVQLAGNLPMQWAYDVVGIAITIAAVFGVMLVSSAVMGFVFLSERVSRRSVAAIALLIGSIVLLSLGEVVSAASNRKDAHSAAASSPDDAPSAPGSASTGHDIPGSQAALWGLLGVAAGCLTGLMFAALSTVVRFTATARVPVTTIVFVVTGMGVLSMGSLSIARLGTSGLIQTDPGQLLWMLASGAFNLVAFLSITKGLQLTTVVRANVLNASQVAMAAVAGVWLFDESGNVWVVLGIALTISGIILIGQPARRGACAPTPNAHGRTSTPPFEPGSQASRRP
jgi:DME family drug/metabolite transporter